MALSDILLRTLSHPILVAKGSALTWVEEDTNFVEIFESLEGVTDFTNSGVAAYDGGTTYTEDDIVTYNGFLYTYINPVDSSGNIPTNQTYWELTGGASLAHVKNKDQYLDFGGAYEVSAQEIREFIDTPLDISTKWDLAGNNLSARGVFGSLSGSAYGWDYKINNVTKGGYYNSGHSFVTGKFLQGYNDESLFSGNNFVTVADTDDGSTSAFKVYASSFGTPLMNMLTDGKLRLSASIYDSGGNIFFDVPNRLLYSSPGFGSVGAISANDFALYPNNSFSSLEWDLRICKDSSNDETFDWENREFTKDWKFNGNVGIGGSSYGGGTQQYFQLESVSPSSTAPTGGIRKQVVNGAEFTLLPSGENICTAGKVITDADDYTQTVGVVKMKYTGAGGHTFTMHTAVGYAGSSYVIKNSGSGNLTIDANSTETIDGNLTEVVPAGESRVLYSDGSNLFII